MRISIEAPDDPVQAARWVSQVAESIAAGKWTGYVSFHQNWDATPGCVHLTCRDASASV